MVAEEATVGGTWNRVLVKAEGPSHDMVSVVLVMREAWDWRRRIVVTRPLSESEILESIGGYQNRCSNDNGHNTYIPLQSLPKAKLS